MEEQEGTTKAQTQGFVPACKNSELADVGSPDVGSPDVGSPDVGSGCVVKLKLDNIVDKVLKRTLTLVSKTSGP